MRETVCSSIVERLTAIPHPMISGRSNGATSTPAVYEKYKERGGRPVFHPDDLTPFTLLLTDLYNLASSSDYIRDM